MAIQPAYVLASSRKRFEPGAVLCVVDRVEVREDAVGYDYRRAAKPPAHLASRVSSRPSSRSNAQPLPASVLVNSNHSRGVRSAFSIGLHATPVRRTDGVVRVTTLLTLTCLTSLS